MINLSSPLSSIPKSLIETGGLKIYTTLDVEAQEALEKAVTILHAIEEVGYPEVHSCLIDCYAKEKDRENQKKNPLGLDQRLKDMENLKEIDRQFQKEKQNNQKLYKEYLDNQNEVNYLAKLNKPPEDTRPQLLMPAYWYPNRPIPIHKKAKDSLLFSKNPNNYFDKDMNRFFHWDSQYNTLMDYDSSGRYGAERCFRSERKD